jgi:hypothetical protein
MERRLLGEGWDSGDWLVWFNERAGILEYDEGLPRAEAERIASREVEEAKAALKADTRRKDLDA